MTRYNRTHDGLRRRAWLALTGLTFMSVLLSACKQRENGLPKPPYGQALDLTRANTFVEFDFRIDIDEKRNPLGRYDIVLEIFDKTVLDKTDPDKNMHPDLSRAYFKVYVHSLGTSEEVVVEREVRGLGEFGSSSSKWYGPSDSEKTKLMARAYFLIEEQPLPPGSYRIRCVNLEPMPAFEGRLVKVTVEKIRYPK